MNTAIPTSVRRQGLGSLLFGIFRPREARVATLTADALRLTLASRTVDIPFGEIEAVELTRSWSWGGLRIRHASGRSAVSGLPREAARSIATALDAARREFWRKALSERHDQIGAVHDRITRLLDPPGYVRSREHADLVREAEVVIRQVLGKWPDSLSALPEIRMLESIRSFLTDSAGRRASANAIVVASELNRSKEFFDRIEARPLTDEQRRAVVVDDDRNLVVAAAGSGKTSVIVAKTGWLIHRKFRRPSELLLLAFARDARNEMAERIRERLGGASGGEVTVRTFHSLGMAIIGEAEGKRPDLSGAAEGGEALDRQLKGIVTELLADRALSERVLDWFQSQFAPYQAEQEFQNWGAYLDYIRKYEIVTLQGERVKSFQECEIANFLYLHRVRYEYEARYEHDTSTSKKSAYRPDFHLPDSGIYIEHFGVDAAGNTAPWIDREEYHRSMDWKRKLHAGHGTVLIETFSHEHSAGLLLRNLEAKLKSHGVAIEPVPPSETFAALEQRGRMTPFLRLLATFLHHFKGARLTLDEVARRAEAAADPLRARAFLAVFRAVYERYERDLRERDQIDFHDMINRATDHVEAGTYRSPFGYILVDEFQDISPGRARLLKALLDQSPGNQLCAVGDDWQSIYRFGGADIAVMREFESRLGAGERLYLENTFRCCDRIAEVATRFVLGNPAQIRKEVRALRVADGPSVHIGLPGDDGTSLLQEAFGRIAADAARQDGASSVLLLGRYQHERPQHLSALAKDHPGLQVSFKTVHGSKGLEADYVLVLGLCSGKYGFPAEIADDPLLDLVLASPEEHPNAEERRLFYVALTRAKRQVFLLAEGGPPSPFVTELIQQKYGVTVFGRLPEKVVSCPVCVRGRMERRENARNKGVFYGCSNYPYCEHKSSACPVCGEGLPVRTAGKIQCRDCGQIIESCPACDGWLQLKMGRYGRFHGCSNWPRCRYTRNLGRDRGKRRKPTGVIGRRRQFRMW